jgi:thymidylate kinase
MSRGRPKKYEIKNKYHIIIEGIDCSGKSSLIKKMQELFLKRTNQELIYHHFQFPKGDTLDQRVGYQMGQFNLFFDFLSKMKNDWFIFDRSHIGEYVYSLKFRQHMPTYVTHLEQTYKNLPIKIIQTVCDPKVIIQRFNQFRPNEKCPTLQMVTELQNEFIYYVKKSVFPEYIINTTDNPNIEAEVIKYIESELI